jgi:hypothetical protein
MFKRWKSPMRGGLSAMFLWAGSFALSGLAEPVITEFLADNRSRLADEDGEYPDWIEIYNPDETPVSLEGFHLTDDPENLSKWTFPAVHLPPTSFLVVFASGKNRLDANLPLHTNFQLSSGGEYLALVEPVEGKVIGAFAPTYPIQFENESFGIDPDSAEPTWSYFSTPTPGEANVGASHAGPSIKVNDKNPPQPEETALPVSITLHEINAPIDSVTLYYLKNYERERSVAMTDDGVNGDEVAGDGVWTGTIPSVAFAPAQMTRWRFEAVDTAGNLTMEPAYRDRRDSHQYYGTVAKDPAIKTLLPILHWFTRSPSGAGTSTGSRGSVYYEGEFYDNVHFNLHGQSSAGFPKKSYNIDFNSIQRFRWSRDVPRVADIDLLTNWADKSKVRHVLGYEIMRESGVAAHFAFTLRVQQNGEFFSTADFVEDADEIYLERAGLNPEGALYKMYDNTLNRSGGDNARKGVEKKTRKFENNDDLQDLIDGMALRGAALSDYLYDNIDIPACVNFLAANSVIRNIDMHRKNWYIYRDTGRSDEWAILPWDLDLSHGRVWNSANTYFDNRLYTDGFVRTGTAVRLVSHMFADEDMRSMIMRRIRALSDRFLHAPPAPGTPDIELYYERRLNEQMALIDPPSIVPSDARLDFEKWGSWLQRGANVPSTHTHSDVESMEEAIERFRNEYLPARRDYIYNRQTIGNGGEIPASQTGDDSPTQFVPLVSEGASAEVIVPSDDVLGDRWTGDPAFEPFDTSRWMSGLTGIGYDTGTTYDSMIKLNIRNEMQSNTSVYIRIPFEMDSVPEVNQLELRIKYDDGFVAYLNGEILVASNVEDSVAWNSASRLAHSAHPRRFSVFDVSDKKSLLRQGTNILAIHGMNEVLNDRDFLILPELHASVTRVPMFAEPTIQFGTIESNPTSGNQDEEYIQLVNRNSIAVDISDWQLKGGVKHVFVPGTVIAPGRALYVCPDSATFRARSVSPKGGEGLFVQGGYTGHLSNFGETITLVDARGAFNNETSYESEASDAQSFLMVSEIMYHPAKESLAEFIEVLNTSSSVSIDLTGIRFTQGIEFDFTNSSVPTLAPGERVLVVRDALAFQRVYGSHLPVAGVFENGTALGNGGDRIKLEDAQSGTILNFSYNDQDPWPSAADGEGFSLVLIDPTSHPDLSDASSWRVSSSLGGDPGSSGYTGFQGDPLADVDGNGEYDLVDVALGNDSGRSELRPTFRWETGVDGVEDRLLLIIPFNPENQGLRVVPSFSTNLQSWESGSIHLERIATEPLEDGRALQIWNVKSPLRDQPRLFMQLRIMQP